ncbi:MAG: hypothetical protein LR008_01235 [Candidatus Pacebacteria bacterium]|nr:hypothetical protein [Candidatus Paceibacterota bacterium]
MTFFIILVTIIQTFAISLGTGASTLAIANFFVAIADGTIDETERKMMGIVYVVLRVAMVLILVTTTLLIAPEYSAAGIAGLSAFTIGQIAVLLVLYTNALLMTAHLIPTTFGPAIQAGSWYTLGTLTALQILGVTDFTLLEFFMGYITWVILAIAIVNGTMAVMKAKREERELQEQE